MNFDKALDYLLRHEGGYSNNRADPGGETNYGITKRVAEQHGYHGSMRSIPLSVVRDIYRESYWDKCRCDDLPDHLQFHVFDAAVNSGVGRAIKWLQSCAGVTQDGVIGPVTLAKAYGVSAAMYSGVRLAFMTDLPHWDTFGRGWARRIADNLRMAE